MTCCAVGMNSGSAGLGDERRVGRGDNLQVTRCKVAVKIRMGVRGWSPGCAEGWRGWRKPLIYWCRW